MNKKEKAYEKATMQELGGNPFGTRQDVVWRSMDIFAKDVSIKYLDWAIMRMFPNLKSTEVPENAEQLYELFTQSEEYKEFVKSL